MVSHFGNGDTTKITEQYTREIIRQVIDEYDDLDGLGITLGERMGGQSPDERRAWLDRTVFAGMRDAKRRIKFVYRAPLSADNKSGGTTSYENDQRTRRQAESLDVIGPAYVEFKYNWSHGHSSPNLFMVHGGKLSDAYWNPRSEKLKAIWTVRNEDFFVLRWGHFADKLRGGLALAQFRRDHQPSQQQQAVAYLEKTVGHWKQYIRTVGYYNKASFPFHTREPFSLEALLPQVEADVQIARQAR